MLDFGSDEEYEINLAPPRQPVKERTWAEWRGETFTWRWWLGIKSKAVSKPPTYGRVTVVVPAYNEESHIADTIHGIRAQTRAVDNTIVVDDCSTDNTGRVARALGVTVLRPPTNTGSKSRALNYALDPAVVGSVDTDFFVCVDADTILAPDAIEHAMQYFNDPSCVAVCGTVIPQVISTMWERGRFLVYAYDCVLPKATQAHFGMVLVASGCFTIFSTELVRKVGCFRDTTMAEDMDLTWRLNELGYRTCFAPDAHCYPLDPPTFTIYKKQVERWFRGFLQCIKIRRWNLFPTGIKLALLVYYNLFILLLDVLVLPVLMYFWNDNLLWAFIFGMLFELVTIGIIGVVGAWRLGLLWQGVRSLYALPAAVYTTRVVLWYCFYQEIIRGRSLNVWHKGH